MVPFGMSPTLFLNRIDPGCNMARFYGLAVEPTLFGEWMLCRRWGRIGTAGQAKMQTFTQQDEAIAGLEHIERIKRKRGYCDSR